MADLGEHPGFRPLDNAGKLFPSIASNRVTSYFRLSVTLKEPVRKGVLQDALDAVMTRYPYFQTGLRSGVFWYVLEDEPEPPQVMPDSAWPCMPLARRFRSRFLLRIRWFGARIALEVSHALTDGTGALLFLRSLTAEYLQQCGHRAEEWGDIPRPGQPVDPQEFSDAFLPLYEKGYPVPPLPKPAFHVPGRLVRHGEYGVVTGIVPAGPLLEAAKTAGTTLTGFLTAVLLLALQEVRQDLPEGRRRRQSPFLRVVVPVNLRKLFPSPTRRNFFLTVPIEVDTRLGRYSLEELCRRVHTVLQTGLEEKVLKTQISRNVRSEHNLLARLSPLPLKNLVLSSIFSSLEARVTTSLSNLGVVAMPDALIPHIDRFEFLPPPSPYTKVNVAVISWQGRVFITFGKLIHETGVERGFFTTLRKLGLSIKVETNQEV